MGQCLSLHSLHNSPCFCLSLIFILLSLLFVSFIFVLAFSDTPCVNSLPLCFSGEAFIFVSLLNTCNCTDRTRIPVLRHLSQYSLRGCWEKWIGGNWRDFVWEISSAYWLCRAKGFASVCHLGIVKLSSTGLNHFVRKVFTPSLLTSSLYPWVVALSTVFKLCASMPPLLDALHFFHSIYCCANI